MAKGSKKDFNKILRARGLPSYDDYHKMNQSEGFVPTGYEDLDNLICEGGGIPTGKVTEIAGAYATGKSLLMKMICNRDDINALYIDTENALPNHEVDKMNCTVISESVLENVWGIVNDALDEHMFELIVIDSAANLVPVKELEDDTDPGMNTSMERSKLMTIWSRQLINKLRGSGCALVFVNHLKQKVGVHYTDFYTPGGNALPFATSLRLYLTSPKGSLIKEGKAVVGQKIKVKIDKNRFGPRLGEVDLDIHYANVYS